MKISELPISNPDRNGYRQRIAIRYDKRDFAPGDVVPQSYQWIDGETTDTNLEGTCTIGYYHPEANYLWKTDYEDIADDGISDVAEFSRRYFYSGHAYLVEGEEIMSGEDRDELILRNPVVLCKLIDAEVLRATLAERTRDYRKW